jgi:hypothetical protein
MKNTLQKQRIIEIIREMVSADSLVIARQIVSEVKNQLGIEVSLETIRSLRRKIGLGSFDIFHKRYIKELEGIWKDYKKEGIQEKDNTVIMRELAINMVKDASLKEELKTASKDDLFKFFKDAGFEI